MQSECDFGSLSKPPVPPWSASDKTSFAYESTTSRWQQILSNVINHLWQVTQEVSCDTQKASEAKRIISRISELKYQSCRNHRLLPLDDDGEANIALYNEIIARVANAGEGTWFTASWLLCETYLYRRLRTFFASSHFFRNFDPFHAQKIQTFKSSATSVIKAIQLLADLIDARVDPSMSLTEEDTMLAAFLEMAQMALWGNATDLSLLTSLTHDDIQNLQSSRQTKATASTDPLLINDLPAAWKHISTLSHARIDIVLDNAAFELVCDLVFADWLISCTQHVDVVVFHAKDIPWFVSDALPRDIKETMDHLLHPAFFPGVGPKAVKLLKATGERWQSHFASGRWHLSTPLNSPLGVCPEIAKFWTNPLPYWDIVHHSHDLLHELQQSGLVIFKGDLNYRRLTFDAKWSSDTSFRMVLGPLAGKIPILALRTLKADVIVGLQRDTANVLDKTEPRWRVSDDCNGPFKRSYLCSLDESILELSIRDGKGGENVS